MIKAKLKEGIKEIANSKTTYMPGIIYSIEEKRFDKNVMVKIEEPKPIIKEQPIKKSTKKTKQINK